MVTALYTAILAIWLIVLSFRVIALRGRVGWTSPRPWGHVSSWPLDARILLCVHEEEHGFTHWGHGPDPYLSAAGRGFAIALARPAVSLRLSACAYALIGRSMFAQ